ncbi:MAG: saccharopine dehydrogenase [Hyphomicrobiales bacterium]|nr:saccharopine dehydrogenase [Hyphomicrobiales bacterium]
MANGEFDIVLWGATGAVGRRAAYHLAHRTSRSDIRCALGGRDAEKLKRVRDDLGPAGSHLEIVVGDSKDREFLASLAGRSRVICSTVGPFALYGSELVEACAKAGTHYCDLTGEPYWMRQMIDAHQAEAQRSGARIVHSCGHDSIPSDLGVLFLQKAAIERFGSPCRDVRIRITKFRGGFSGGTAASFVYAMEEGPKNPTIGKLMADPYALNPAGERDGPDGPDLMMPIRTSFDPELKVWTKPYFMAPMNAKTVRRSNALLRYLYGKDFRYKESDTSRPGIRGWFGAISYTLAARLFLIAMALPFTRAYLRKNVLPKSGEGPGAEVRERGTYEMIAIGAHANGQVIRATIVGRGDPGVESTSRMLVEAALCLAEDDIAVGGGFWTPASALGSLLRERVTAHAGLSFELME